MLKVFPACPVRSPTACFACGGVIFISHLLTRNVEGVPFRSSQHPNSTLLLPLPKALRVQRLSIKMVLHDIGDPHVIVDEAQLAECSVQ